MKLLKITLPLFFILTVSNVFAQKKVDNKISNCTSQVNTRLTEHNKNLKLSESQEKQVNTLCRAFFVTEKETSKAIRNKEKFKEAIKSERRKLNQSIKDILTSEQLKAYNSYQAK